jgi:hypothetical protein
MEHPVYLNRSDRRSLQGREEDPSERVSNGDTEAPLKGLSDELSIEGGERFFFHFQPLGSNEVFQSFLMHIASPEG